MKLRTALDEVRRSQTLLARMHVAMDVARLPPQLTADLLRDMRTALDSSEQCIMGIMPALTEDVSKIPEFIKEAHECLDHIDIHNTLGLKEECLFKIEAIKALIMQSQIPWEQIDREMDQGNKITAIKLYRQATMKGLADSKHDVEQRAMLRKK